MNEFKGFSLFNDVEDAGIRNYNRARVLNNMYEDNMDKNGKLNGAGMSLVVQYFDQIADEDKGAVHSELSKIMEAKKVRVL